MKHRLSRSTMTGAASHQGGSILVLAMLIMLAGAFGLMAMVTLVGARAKNVHSEEDGVKRRAIRGNSRSLALDYLRNNTLVSSSGSSATTVALADGWGAASIPAVASAPLASLLQPGLTNRLNPGNGKEFVLNATVPLSDGISNQNLVFSMKSRNPMLSGDLLTLKGTANATAYEIGEVVGRTRLLSAPVGAIAFKTSHYSSRVGGFASIGDLAGAALPVSNFPEVAVAMGSNGTGLDAVGAANSIFNPNTAINSIYQRMVNTGNFVTIDGTTSYNLGGIKCNGAGDVDITLNDPSLKHVYLNNNLDDITLYGQSSADFAAAGTMAPIIIVIREDSSSSLTMDYVKLINANNRPLILAIHSQPLSAIELPLEFPDNLAWRSLIHVEGTKVKVRANNGNYSGRTALLIGGIQGSKDVMVPFGMTMKIYKETDPSALLESMAPRYGWIETYRAP